MATHQVGIGEAAKRLALSRTSVQKLVDSGQLAAIKTAGGHRRILASALDELDEKIGPRAMQKLAATGMKQPREGDHVLHPSELSVLIVEDDAVVAANITENLAAFYPEVHCVVTTDGLEAVLQIERQRPSILITDLNMRPFDGFSLVKMVSSKTEYQSMAIVVISSLNAREIEERGGLPDNVLFFQKPLSMERVKGFFDAYVLLHRKQAAKPA